MNADGTPVTEDSTETDETAETSETTDPDFDSDVYVAEADTETEDFTVGEDSFADTENETDETYETISSEETYDPTIETVDPTFVETPTYDATTFDSTTTSTEPSYLSSENVTN